MPRVRGEGCQPDDPRTICGGQSRAGISQNPGSPVQLRRAAPAEQTDRHASVITGSR